MVFFMLLDYHSSCFCQWLAEARRIIRLDDCENLPENFPFFFIDGSTKVIRGASLPHRIYMYVHAEVAEDRPEVDDVMI